MLVRADGTIDGTIGGGIGEYEIIAQARRAISSRQSLVTTTSLAGEQGLDSPAICGGWFQTAIAFWSPEDYRKPAKQIANALEQGLTLMLFEYPGGGIVTYEPATGQSTSAGNLPLSVETLLTAWKKEQQPGLQELDGQQLMVTPLLPPPQMVIFGAGHLAIPLVEMASWCGFATTVIDDRDEFADPGRFPKAKKVLTAPMDAVKNLVAPSMTTYFVLITREHRHDDLLLRQLLGLPYAYLGMIGSRRRTTKVKERLVDDGYPVAEIEAIHSPIGLEIGAQTPEEIAISIMAEIISVKNR